MAYLFRNDEICLRTRETIHVGLCIEQNLKRDELGVVIGVNKCCINVVRGFCSEQN